MTMPPASPCCDASPETTSGPRGHFPGSGVFRPSDAVVGSETERNRIPDFAANPIESVGDEFHRHERVGREWALKRARLLSGKTKARIIIRVSENEDNVLALPAQQIQATSNEVSSNGTTLILG